MVRIRAVGRGGARVTRRAVAATQGTFNVLTGLWPMVHMNSFNMRYIMVTSIIQMT